MIPCCSCGHPKDANVYLCRACWFSLSRSARTRLNQRDSKALARLRQMRDQIAAGVPLGKVQVLP